MSQPPSHPAPSASVLVAFLDRGAPYRGRWLITADADGQAYAACHELEARVIDQRQLHSVIEVRRFSSHLILHGWSPQEVEGQHGYRLLGLGR